MNNKENSLGEMKIIGTLRSAAAARGIKAITVEIGNPQTFQDRYIQVTIVFFLTIRII